MFGSLSCPWPFEIQLEAQDNQENIFDNNLLTSEGNAKIYKHVKGDNYEIRNNFSSNLNQKSSLKKEWLEVSAVNYHFIKYLIIFNWSLLACSFYWKFHISIKRICAEDIV